MREGAAGNRCLLVPAQGKYASDSKLAPFAGRRTVGTAAMHTAAAQRGSIPAKCGKGVGSGVVHNDEVALLPSPPSPPSRRSSNSALNPTDPATTARVAHRQKKERRRRSLSTSGDTEEEEEEGREGGRRTVFREPGIPYNPKTTVSFYSLLLSPPL